MSNQNAVPGSLAQRVGKPLPWKVLGQAIAALLVGFGAEFLLDAGGLSLIEGGTFPQVAGEFRHMLGLADGAMPLALLLIVGQMLYYAAEGAVMVYVIVKGRYEASFGKSRWGSSRRNQAGRTGRGGTHRCSRRSWERGGKGPGICASSRWRPASPAWPTT